MKQNYTIINNTLKKSYPCALSNKWGSKSQIQMENSVFFFFLFFLLPKEYKQQREQRTHLMHTKGQRWNVPTEIHLHKSKKKRIVTKNYEFVKGKIQCCMQIGSIIKIKK